MKAFAVKINTDNDVNGNPRRGWFVYLTPGICEAFVDEGYYGDRALTDRFPDVIVTLVIDVPVREYRTAKRVQKEREQTAQ